MLGPVNQAHRLLLTDNDMGACPKQPPDRGILDSLEPIQQAVAECPVEVCLQAIYKCLNDKLWLLKTAEGEMSAFLNKEKL